MLCREDKFDARDGLALYERRWLPDAASEAVVAIVHGICEHGGRYARLAGDLTKRGYAVEALDLRGHGLSDGPRVMVRAFDDYLDDVKVFLDRVSARHPGKALFLLGHSMGGAVAALTAIDRRPNVRGLVLSAPAVMIGGKVFPVLRRLVPLVGRVWSSLRLARMGCRFISRDPAVVAAFQTDPLVYHGRFPVRTGAEILRAAHRIQAGAERLTLPLLILHGAGDLVTDCRGSRQLASRAGSADKTLRLYSGLYHEIFSEPERDEVIADLVAWLDERRA